MIELLTFCLLASLWCVGVALATDEGYILHRIEQYAFKNFPQWFYNPLIGCVYCMASIHGTFMYLMACVIGWQDFNALELIICIPIISAINGLIMGIHSKML